MKKYLIVAVLSMLFGVLLGTNPLYTFIGTGVVTFVAVLIIFAFLYLLFTAEEATHDYFEY